MSHSRGLSNAFAQTLGTERYRHVLPDATGTVRSLLGDAAKVIREITKFRRDKVEVVVLSRLAVVNLVPILSRLLGAEVWIEVNGPLSIELASRQQSRIRRQVLKTIGRVAEWSQLAPAAGMWAVTPGIADFYRGRFASSRVVVIPNGTTQTLLPSPSSQDDTLQVLFGGALTPWYDLVGLVEALSNQPGVRLILAGEGPERSKVQNAIDRSGAKNITFLGWQGPDDLETLMASSHMAVVPLLPKHVDSDAVGSPLKLFDYLSAGLVVIAPDLDGVREIAAPSLVTYTPGHLSETLRKAIENYAELRTEVDAAPGADYSWLSRARTFLSEVSAPQ